MKNRANELEKFLFANYQECGAGRILALLRDLAEVSENIKKTHEKNPGLNKSIANGYKIAAEIIKKILKEAIG